MADPKIRDFQTTRARAATAQLTGNPNTQTFGGDLEAQRSRRHSSAVSADNQSPIKAQNSSAISPRPSVESLKRRVTRHNTVRNYSHSPSRGQYEVPGAEPGIDTQQEDAVQRFQHVQAECQITVVDFSEDRIRQHELDNRSFADFIVQPKPDWVACRWININGISFDVIRLLQKEKNLHRLAVEDLLQSRSRTKADWYSDHAFRKWIPLPVLC